MYSISVVTGSVGGNLSNTVMYSPGAVSGLASMTPMPGVCGVTDTVNLSQLVEPVL